MGAESPLEYLARAREAVQKKPFADIPVPARYMGARLTDFEAVLKLKHPNRDGLYVTGPAGVGKTHLATAWMAYMVPDLVRLHPERAVVVYPSVFWITVPELLCELRSTFSNKSASEREVLTRYCKADLLLLDDLGAQKISDWTIESLYLLVSNRINYCRPTIVTSNFRLSELDAIDSRLASRLGGMEYQEMTGKDRRLEHGGTE